MKHIKTLVNGNKPQVQENKDMHHAFSCKSSVTVGWQPNEKKIVKED